ncbi:hypothetical protein C4566_03000 [Candidatus Parcubacteria bacterium]|nr:MAG: hypothetical protein C4566_03000 [Candidatus Parcubacteria bacterium]
MKLLKYKLFLLLALFPLMASALDPMGSLDTAANQTGLITRRPADVIATVINALLGLLGTVFTVLIILGGFRWMTSQGNKDKVQEARELIKNATIGLGVVLLSYVIVRFVMQALMDSTGATPQPVIIT